MVTNQKSSDWCELADFGIAVVDCVYLNRQCLGDGEDLEEVGQGAILGGSAAHDLWVALSCQHIVRARGELTTKGPKRSNCTYS